MTNVVAAPACAHVRVPGSDCDPCLPLVLSALAGFSSRRRPTSESAPSESARPDPDDDSDDGLAAEASPRASLAPPNTGRRAARQRRQGLGRGPTSVRLAVPVAPLGPTTTRIVTRRLGPSARRAGTGAGHGFPAPTATGETLASPAPRAEVTPRTFKLTPPPELPSRIRVARLTRTDETWDRLGIDVRRRRPPAAGRRIVGGH